jgi:hypothetical protein
MAFGQLDNPNNTVNFEYEEKETEAPTGYELPAFKLPSLSDPKDPFKSSIDTSLGLEEPEKVDITKDDGLLDYTIDKAPRGFTKDKGVIALYGEDQALGKVRTRASTVNIVYRDHEYVDGDIIRVYVNKDVVRSSITLGGSFNGFDIPLEVGENIVEFKALNQGSSGPNTAELHVYDDKGELISAKQWNLLTGYTATIIIIKD